MNLILLILGRLYNINISSYQNHTDYAILLCNKQGVSPSPAARRHRHASHFSTLQFTCTLHKHLALYLAVYHLTFSHFRTSQFTHARNKGIDRLADAKKSHIKLNLFDKSLLEIYCSVAVSRKLVVLD